MCFVIIVIVFVFLHLSDYSCTASISNAKYSKFGVCVNFFDFHKFPHDLKVPLFFVILNVSFPPAVSTLLPKYEYMHNSTSSVDPHSG